MALSFKKFSSGFYIIYNRNAFILRFWRHYQKRNGPRLGSLIVVTLLGRVALAEGREKRITGWAQEAIALGYASSLRLWEGGFVFRGVVREDTNHGGEIKEI